MAKRSAAPKKKRPGVMNKFDMAISVVEGSIDFYNKGRSYWRDNFAYTVTVSEQDLLYNELHAWLTSTLPNEKHRSIAVSSGSRYSPGPVGESDVSDKPTPVVIHFNDKSIRKMSVGGHPVTVQLVEPEMTKDMERRPSVIQFVARSYDGQQAVVQQLERLNNERSSERKAVLKMTNSWGDWRTRSDLPPRTMDSVSLPKEQKERIVEDLRNFLDSEEKYNRLAIPWHRGYMLKGPPGTGKTSLVKALAHEFNLDLWYISLSDLSSESSLLGLISGVGPRSILLLEDIDTANITHDRDGAEQGKISMSSLLNSLDGVATPHGLVTFMTTNRFEILDPALTRAGRMDLIEELAYPSLEVIGDMFSHYFDIVPVWAVGNLKAHMYTKGISTAQIAEVLKHHMDDYESAERLIHEMLFNPTPKVNDEES